MSWSISRNLSRETEGADGAEAEGAEAEGAEAADAEVAGSEAAPAEAGSEAGGSELRWRFLGQFSGCELAMGGRGGGLEWSWAPGGSWGAAWRSLGDPSGASERFVRSWRVLGSTLPKSK